MTFCCEHTRIAHELITEAFSSIKGKSERGPSSGAETFRSFIPYASLYDKSCLHDVINDYENWMIKAKIKLKEADDETKKCNCTEIKRLTVSHLEESKKLQNEFIQFGKEKLNKTENQLINAQNKIENLEVVRTQFNNLRVEDVRNREEMKNLRVENKSLKEQLRELKEENVLQKISFKEEKLNRLVFRLDIDDNLIQKLQTVYKLSIYSQFDNSGDITTAKRNILNAAGRENFEEVERICEMCREIAELKVQLQQIRSEQAQEQQEFSSLVLFNPNTR